MVEQVRTVESIIAQENGCMNKGKLPTLSPKLEQLLLRQCGLAPEEPFTGKALHQIAHAVKTISDHYITTSAENIPDFFKNAVLLHAYLLYYLPVNLVKLFGIADELAATNFSVLPRSPQLRVLDLGCGPGTYLLGFLELVRKYRAAFSTTASITWVGIDRSRAALNTAARLLQEYRAAEKTFASPACTGSFQQALLAPAHLRTALRKYDNPFHIIIAGNVVTELNPPEVQRLLPEIVEHMEPDGLLLVIDPGTKKSFPKFLALREAALRSSLLQVYAPCLQFAPCPLVAHSSAWCHALLHWEPPRCVALLDRVLPFDKKSGIAYSYLVFTKQPADRLAPYPDVPRDTVWRVVSSVMHSRGEEKMYVCNGRQRVLLRRLIKNATKSNSDFPESQRGSLVVVRDYEDRGHFFDIRPETVFQNLYLPGSLLV